MCYWTLVVAAEMGFSTNTLFRPQQIPTYIANCPICWVLSIRRYCGQCEKVRVYKYHFSEKAELLFLPPVVDDHSSAFSLSCEVMPSKEDSKWNTKNVKENIIELSGFWTILLHSQTCPWKEYRFLCRDLGEALCTWSTSFFHCWTKSRPLLDKKVKFDYNSFWEGLCTWSTSMY